MVKLRTNLVLLENTPNCVCALFKKAHTNLIILENTPNCVCVYI